jgi:DNA repair exonuclease SbcCD nuclease subunit
MKIALITDTHYNFKKASKVFHEYFAKFYNDIFFPYLEENNIKTVIHLGDAFDNRKGIDYWALKWAKENVYDKIESLGIDLYSIVGNHDTYFKNTNLVNSNETLLGEYQNIVKISSPKEFTIGGTRLAFIPWICKDNQNEVFDFIENTQAKIAFGHFELSGFIVFPGQYQKNGLDKSILQKFDKVYSGHYHTPSDDGKIFYIGNPYQMFWNDLNDKRGFTIFDTETLETEFIENPYTIFERVYYEDSDYKKLDTEMLDGKIVKVVVRKKTDIKNFEKFIDKISNSNIIELKIIENLDIYDEDVEYNEEEFEDTLKILNKYIEESDFDLNKEKVKKIIGEIYSEALELE